MARASLSITVAAGLAVRTVPTPPYGQVGVPYPGISPGTTGGTGPVKWTVTSGSLPFGLSLDVSTGAITGTPTNVGIYPFTLTATDSGLPVAQTASVSLSVTVQGPPLVITTTTLGPGEAGYFYTGGNVQRSGGYGSVTMAVTGGSLPSGLTMDGDGFISGIVPPNPGVYTFTVTATDSSTPPLVAKATLSIAVVGDLAVTTTTLPSGQLGAPYTGATLASTGGTAPVTWTANPGNLPPGLTLDPATGAITGTPTAVGTSIFEVYANDAGVTDPQEAYAQESITITNTPLQITPVTPPVNLEFDAVSWPLSATGGVAPYTWSEAGALPTGVTFNTTTGLISGTPTVSGQYNLTVTVKDANGAKASAVEPVDISPNPPYVTVPESFLSGGDLWLPGYNSVGLVYGGGEGPYSFAVTSGALPTGITLNRSTGVISGMLAGEIYTTTFTVTMTDSEVPAAKASVAITLYGDGG